MAATRSSSKIARSVQNRVAARWLRTVRKRLNWTQAEVASNLSRQMRISITEGQVYFWERGNRTIPGAVLLTMWIIANALLGSVPVPEFPSLRK